MEGIQLQTRMTQAEFKAAERDAKAYNAGLSAELGRQVGENDMGKDQFLKLLVTQMSHQDPLSPMDNTQMVAQMAQFTTVEQLINANKTIDEMKTMWAAGNAFDMLGKNVTFVAMGGDTALTGAVDSLFYEKGVAKLGVTTELGYRLAVDPADVLSVHDK